MTNVRIYSPDIECDSCVKVLGRVLNKTTGITSFKITTEYLDITHDKNLTTKKLLELIRTKGYRASLEQTDRPSISERTKEFLTDKKKYAIEWRMLRYIGLTTIILLALQAGLLLFMRTMKPNIITTHWPWMLYLVISTAFIAGAIWHFKTYRTTVTCMTGMMIGMTIGMQTGMLIGAVIGVTNGFFWGAMTGMVLGSIVGAWTGKCCGIMGVMEGMMAGIMGGTMGAMITVMMFYDHVHLFMPVYVLLNIAILLGFSYMLFEELVEGKDVHIQTITYARFISISVLGLLVLNAIIFFAPVSIFLG